MSKRVEDYVKWCHAVANTILPPYHDDHDDLVQEGLIEIDRCIKAKGGDPSAVYLTRAARHRMIGAARDGKWTGLPDRRERSGPPPAHADSLELLLELEEEGMGEIKGLGRLDDELTKVEWSLLVEDIRKGRRALSERDDEYVELRFYHGLIDVEIGQMTGHKGKVVSNRWGKVVKPILQGELEHLRPLVA